MKNLLLICAASVALSACSTMQPPRYSPSTENIVKLREYEGASVNVVSFSQEGKFSAGCRMMGPIEPADGLSVPEFVAKAFNDEFKMANIHSEDGAGLTGVIKHIEFSSSSGLTNGYWKIDVAIESTSGVAIESSVDYKFKSGFDAITACNATADALSAAVQDLIQNVVIHPEFPALIDHTSSR